MSKNRRHGTDGSRAAINEFLTRPAPVTLTPEQIGPWPVVEAFGETVDVWLRFVEIRVQERAVALAYTDRAVQVEVTLRSGSTCRTHQNSSPRRSDGPAPATNAAGCCEPCPRSVLWLRQAGPVEASSAAVRHD